MFICARAPAEDRASCDRASSCAPGAARFSRRACRVPARSLVGAGACVALRRSPRWRVAIGTGDFPISPGDVVARCSAAARRRATFIVDELRLPRVLAALLVGAALGVSRRDLPGADAQPARQPGRRSASPPGAAVGALVVIIVFVGGVRPQVAVGALVGGVVTGALVYLLAWRARRARATGSCSSASASPRCSTGGQRLPAHQGAASRRRSRADALAAPAPSTAAAGTQVGRCCRRRGARAAALLGSRRPLRDAGDGRRRRARARRARRARAADRARRRRLLVAVATAAAGPIAFVALAAPQLARRLTRSPGPGLLAVGAAWARRCCWPPTSPRSALFADASCRSGW